MKGPAGFACGPFFMTRQSAVFRSPAAPDVGGVRNPAAKDPALLSRRQMLCTLGGGAATAVAGLAHAQGNSDKLKPEAVAYQTTPMGDQRCATCSKFVAPNICSILTTRVVPAGWCTAWQVKPT